jgi:hypothetical protein
MPNHPALGPRNLSAIRFMDLRLDASLNTAVNGMLKAREVHFMTIAAKPN